MMCGVTKCAVLLSLFLTMASDVSHANGRNQKLLDVAKKQITPLVQGMRWIVARSSRFVAGAAAAGILLTAVPTDAHVGDSKVRGIYWHQHGTLRMAGVHDATKGYGKRVVWGIRNTNLDHYLYNKDVLTAKDYNKVFVSYRRHDGTIAVGYAESLHHALPNKLKISHFPDFTDAIVDVDRVSGVYIDHHTGYANEYREVSAPATHVQPLVPASIDGIRQVSPLFSPVAFLEHSDPARYSGKVKLIISDGNRLVLIDRFITTDGDLHTLEREERFWATINRDHISYEDYAPSWSPTWVGFSLKSKSLPSTASPLSDVCGIRGCDLGDYLFTKASLSAEDYNRVLLTYRDNQGEIAMGLAFATQGAKRITVSNIVPDVSSETIDVSQVNGVAMNYHPAFATANHNREVIIPADAPMRKVVGSAEYVEEGNPWPWEEEPVEGEPAEEIRPLRYYAHVVAVFSDGRRFVRLDAAEDADGEVHLLSDTFGLVHRDDLIR